ncbi:MAG: oligoendopeptidase F [Lactococcus raffinolactis]|jgi:oligoendopeptidase F|uniref:Oligopeptidase F n=1 Tax=Pseudolactococcus raffinolactis TaxID=1366 RepID=A0A290Q5U7_9LACT|nr:oligoendopeptidase F [Lactococcus raffinolactis]ATC60698.1 oligoendopeptidase F [Lactococcus raffinolactis]MBW9331142.1 oligoendopeptidase F [Lactococcus raffinolactis]MDG4961690.1 oligoendopeptidase F [Lactococcus raffinolactis]MDN5413395.1 oligoendopeptidase F [Lactococcus raffinolactis]MDN5414958.1 oligoendopeptidase F [Lactococcus raffinolactis]
MVKKREAIDEKYKWDLTTIFATDEAFEAELAEVLTALEDARNLAGTLTDSAENLLAVTDTELALMQRVEKLYVYASMKNDQDTTVSLYQEYQAKVTALYAKFSEVFAFYEPEFMTLSQERFAQFVIDQPKLQTYGHFFEQLFDRKAHVLSSAEEALLAGASEIFGAGAETFEILDNADIVFPTIRDAQGQDVQLSHGNYISFMESSNREVRKAAYQALYSIYEQYQHTYAKTLQTNVKVHNFTAKTRHYHSAREAALSTNHIPEAVYDTLVQAVNDHLPLLHRYIQLRSDILKIDDLKMYDVYAPLSTTDYKFTYEEAVVKTQGTLAIFGPDYLEKVKRSFEENWIDVQENKGKRSGAYSGGSYDTNAFMLLNWQDTLDNLFTLVHEMGHSMHSSFTRESQPYVYGDYSIFLAEIASTTNENILTETLLHDVEDDETRFAVLNHFLDGFRGTVFRQTQFAEFEHAIHEADAAGTVLTSEFLNQQYAELNEKYYGLAASDNPEIQYEWARIPHFYYNYYVFQYATGFAAASALADKIVNGTEQDKADYLNYLRAGSSDYPLDVIAKAGVDMTSADYLTAAFAVFEKRLTELEALVAKHG